jgi:hypothetical protein
MTKNDQAENKMYTFIQKFAHIQKRRGAVFECGEVSDSTFTS